MGVSIKTESEIRIMREAGKRLAYVLSELEVYVKPGLSTYEVDKKGEELIRKSGGIPSFLGYNGFPASICVSVNDQVVHGIPDKNHFLEEGDIVSLDAGLMYEGFHADAARTLPVGGILPELERLIEVTKESFFKGIEKAREGNYINDISSAVQRHVESNGYSVVRDLAGHGIGRELHEAPDIYNFRQKKQGIKIRRNMTFAVEPMVNMGDFEVEWGEDGWTVYTADYSFSAHYENTILITDGKPEILTL